MTQEYFDEADSSLEDKYVEPMSLDEYVSLIQDTPEYAAHAAQYILRAIESAGTRTVVEGGEEYERYRFFDDPWNDGENAVVGNTDVLNDFVEDLRMIASDRAKEEKMLWVVGPTGTGKSEFKRCLINGLREYSKTEEGRRYTLEWNLRGIGDTAHDPMTYGTQDDVTAGNWYQSPVQSHPLSVFPEDVRLSILSDINAGVASDAHVSVTTDLDPFCSEAYTYLAEQYREDSPESLFSSVTDETHCRVVNYTVEPGQGIGVLNPEDSGKPKQLLIGSWMPDMFEETGSKGRKNPQAFSYDGVLSQGNSVATVIEEAGTHSELLTKLFNVPDEGSVKLDNGIWMDLDTVILLISNPNLASKLNIESDGSTDELRAIKRRLQRHELKYLLTVSGEAELLRREVLDETEVWSETDPEDVYERIRDGAITEVSTDDGIKQRELAPHTIEAAALIDVVSRYSGEAPDPVPESASGGVVQRAILHDAKLKPEWGIQADLDEHDATAADMVDSDDGAGSGLPVTVMRDTIMEILHDGVPERSHSELDLTSVIMPETVLSSIRGKLKDEPMFSTRERRSIEARVGEVYEYVCRQQEADVIDSLLDHKRVGEDGVTEYLKHVYAWVTDEQVSDDDGNTLDPDPFRMKVFETERFGLYKEVEYDGTEPSDTIVEWREDLVNKIKSSNYEDDDDGSFWDVPEVRSQLHTYGWEHVYRIFDDLEQDQWEDPPEGSQTEELKEKTIEAMQDIGYTRESAELTSLMVFKPSESTAGDMKWD